MVDEVRGTEKPVFEYPMNAIYSAWANAMISRATAAGNFICYDPEADTGELTERLIEDCVKKFQNHHKTGITDVITSERYYLSDLSLSYNVMYYKNMPETSEHPAGYPSKEKPILFVDRFADKVLMGVY